MSFSGSKLLVEQVLSKLTIKEDALQHEINEAAFRIFQCVSDHGYFAWKLQGKPKYKNLSRVFSTAEIVDHVDLEAKPNQLVPISSLTLPLAFPILPPQARTNTFPFGQNEASHLYVAANHRGINFDTIDFCFGGSALEMLARKDTSNPYIATMIPEKHTIIVAKRKPYTQNLSDIGYLFEKLVTGKNMKAQSSCIHITEHLHVMKIGDYKVLFCAETDAVDENDRPVEVKISRPKNWGTKVMFQMISSGSSSLCHGEQIGGILQQVKMHSLSSVAKQALRQRDIHALEQNILDGMRAMKDQMSTTNNMEESCFKVSFSRSGELKLIPTKKTCNTAVLPPSDIVKRLLQN